MGSSEGSAILPKFEEGRIPEQKVVENRLFPKVLGPAHQSQKENVEAFVQTILNNKEWLQKQVVDNGAVLFRGFSVRSGADLNMVVEAFGWEEQPYIGSAPRIKVEGRVYTASNAPLHQQIEFHHEMALMKVSPSKLFFFCEIAPPDGGQTAIVESHRVVKRMEEILPEFVDKLKNVGLLFKAKTLSKNTTNSIIGRNWETLLGTNDPKEAEKRAVDIMGCAGLQCFEDGTAEFTFGPLKAIRTFEGQEGNNVWFNTIAGYGEGNHNQSLTLGDGDDIPVEAVNAFKRIMDEECVDLKWEEGDVLLLDNLSVQHARRPSKPPRRVLVSMCK